MSDSSTDSLEAAVTAGASRTRRERVIAGLLFLCASVSVLTTVGIIVSLAVPAAEFFRVTGSLLGVPAEQTVPVVDFFTQRKWSPGLKVDGQYRFGVLELVSGTLAVTFGSAAVALPFGLATAIYLSEYATASVRSVLKPALEVLAGVPTVVYGYFALVYVTPFLDRYTPLELSTFNALSASIIVGIMIIPMVSSISEDAMSAVPDELRQAGYGIGATKFDVSTSVVVPASVSGIFSSFILAISRAIGETMAVTIAMGMTPRFITSPADMTKPASTMTAAMVNLATGDHPVDSAAYRSLFAIGITLFVITLTMNVVSDRVAARYREVYE